MNPVVPRMRNISQQRDGFVLIERAIPDLGIGKRCELQTRSEE